MGQVGAPLLQVRSSFRGTIERTWYALQKIAKVTKVRLSRLGALTRFSRHPTGYGRQSVSRPLEA